MKTSHRVLSVLATLALLLHGEGAFGQGSLTPPGPPGPTMKTLGQIEPRVPIGSLPFTISAPGSYYLTTSLTGIAGSHGLIIDASDVTLDLGGFAISGVPNALNGISVASPRGNLVIRNGTIAHWLNGIDAGAASNSRFDALRISQNASNGLVAGPASTVIGCNCYANQGLGIRVDQSSTIQDTAALANLFSGIVADFGSRIVNCAASYNLANGLVISNNCVVLGIVALNNSLSGIVTGSDVQILNSKASNNGASGIAAGADTALTACSASGNLEAGIAVGAGAQVLDCKVAANSKGIVVQAGSIVRGCTAQQNSGDGIVVTSECTVMGNISRGNFLAKDASGIRVTGKDNAIKENNVISNDVGVLVEGVGNFVIRNTASNNSLNYRIVGAPQAMGPIVTGAFTDNISPIANFEF